MNRCSSCGLRLSADALECPQDGGKRFEQADASPGSRSEAQLTEAQLRESLAGTGFELVGELGRGGFATVYAARKAGQEEEVALKVAAPGSRPAAAALFREALVLRILQGRHAPRLLDKGIGRNGSYYVAMTLQKSATLAELLLESHGPMSISRFLPCALGLLDAVQVLHELALVHCDLKPENIFVEPEGVTLIDFGLTTLAARAGSVDLQMGSEPPPESATTLDRGGTAEYMSPEQCGARSLDQRSDIYALGAIFYEIIAGAPPFWGALADVREAQESRSPVSLAVKVGCPEALSEVIGDCLSKVPRERPANVHELRRALTQAAAGLEPSFRGALQSPRSPVAKTSKTQAETPAPAVQEELHAVLLYFQSQLGAAELSRLAQRTRGQLVFERGPLKVLMFGHEGSEHPADAALACARRLLRVEGVSHARIHVAQVSSRLRRGRRRFFGPALARGDLLPAEDDPQGVYISREVAYMLRGQPFLALDGRLDVFLLSDLGDDTATTQFQAPLPLVGREEPLSELTQSLRECLALRRATLCTLVGAAGMGKSHLAAELQSRIESLGVSTLSVAAQPGDGTRLLANLLRVALDLPAIAPPDGGRERLEQALGHVGAEVWPAAALQLGWLDVEHPEVAAMAAAPGALRAAGSRALGEALRIAARHRPLALLLDDAHAAGDTLLDALEYATLAESDTPLWACVLARPQLTVQRTAWGARAAKSWLSELQGLSKQAADQLLRSSLLELAHVPEQALGLLHQRTQGVPGQMVELVSRLKWAGIVRPIPGGSGHFLATDELERLPDLPVAEWTLQQDLRRLPPDLLRTAQLCAVLGKSFSVAELAAVQRGLESTRRTETWLDPRIALRRLRSAGVLRRFDQEYGFCHPHMGEYLYKRLPNDPRQRWHRAALDSAGALPLSPLESTARKARHSQGCGDLAGASRAYLALANELARRQAYREAESAYANALRDLGESRDANFVAASRGLAGMRIRLNRHAEALDHLVSAREAAQALGDLETETHVLLDEALVRDCSYEFPESALLNERAANKLADPPPLLKARCLVARACSAMRQGDPAGAQLAVQAAELAESLGDEGYEPLINALCVAGGLATEPNAALAHLNRGLELATTKHDVLFITGMLVNRSHVHMALGDAKRALADCDESIRVSCESGIAAEPFARGSRIDNLLALGRGQEAQEEIPRVRALSEALGLASLGYRTDLWQVRASWQLGDRARALHYANNLKARLASAETKTPLMEPDDLELLKAFLLSLGDATVERWEQFLAELSPSVLSPEYYASTLELYAECLKAQGSTEAANAIRQQAIDYCSCHGAPLVSKRIALAPKPVPLDEPPAE